MVVTAETNINQCKYLIVLIQNITKSDLQIVVTKTGNDRKPPQTSTNDHKPPVNDHKPLANH